MPNKTLILTAARRTILSDLGDNLRYAKEARRDSMAARVISETRYYLMGAYDIDIEDDKEIERLLAFCYDNRGGDPTVTYDRAA